MNLGELFRTFDRWAFRLECLPSYYVPEEAAALADFAAGRPLPPDFNAGWGDIVAKATGGGRVIRRLRLVSDEPSGYELFELTAAYGPGLAAGEQIRVDRRSHHPAATDFWLFDGRWKAVMRYNDTGEFLGADVAPVEPDDQSIPYWLGAYDEAPQPLTTLVSPGG